jgi:hypothetical protein
LLCGGGCMGGEDDGGEKTMRRVRRACLATCLTGNRVSKQNAYAFGNLFLKQKGRKQFWPETRF